MSGIEFCGALDLEDDLEAMSDAYHRERGCPCFCHHRTGNPATMSSVLYVDLAPRATPSEPVEAPET